MSAIKIKRVLQQVIGGTNQPIKLGGILEDGSDSVLTIENGSVSGVVKPFDATLPYTSWTGASAPYSKTINVEGILSTDEAEVRAVMSGTYATDVIIETNMNRIFRIVSGSGTLTFYAHSVPTADIPIRIKVVR